MVWACCLWISHGPMCTPSTVWKPRFVVSSRRNDIFSSRKWHVSQLLVAVARPRPPTSCRCRSAACLPSPTAVSGMNPLGCCGLRLADDRLERDLRQLVGELLLAQEVEQRRIAVDRGLVEVAADRDPAPCPATWRMFWRILSNVPWPPRSGRMRLCVSRSPSSVTLTPFRPNGTRRSTTSGVSSRPLVMMLITMLHAARLAGLPQPLGQVVHDRQIQERLAAEERQREALGRDARRGAPRSIRRRAPRCPSTSSPRSCCTRRDRPGCSSRTRSCTAAS